MLIYVFLFALMAIFIAAENESNNKRLLNICFIFIFLLFALRDYSVGTDTGSYIDEYLSGRSLLRNTDFGFAYYTSFLSNLGLPSRSFLVVSSILIVLPVYLYIRQFASKKCITTFLYVAVGTFSMHLSGMRQSIAMGVSMIGCVVFLQIQKQYLKYLILLGCVYLAAQFHGTAVVCYLYLLLFFAAEKQTIFNKQWSIILLLIPILVAVFSSYLAPIVNYFMIYKYEDYELGASNINFIAFFVIPYCIFFYLTILSRIIGLDNRIERFEYLCSFLFVLCASASMYMPMLSRMGYYFSLPMLALVGNQTNKLDISTKRMIIPLLLIICALYFFISTSGGTLGIDNFHFSFD